LANWPAEFGKISRKTVVPNNNVNLKTHSLDLIESIYHRLKVV